VAAHVVIVDGVDLHAKMGNSAEGGKIFLWLFAIIEASV